MKVQNQSVNFVNKAHDAKTTVSQQLASGKRVNSAADDAAALTIIDRLQAQQSGLNQAIRNTNDGVSYTQVAEGALAGVNESILRIEALSLQASNGALTDSDRSAIQQEITQLQESISGTFNDTTFAGQPVFSGSSVEFHVGADANQRQSVSSGDSSLVSGVLSIDVSTQAGAQAALNISAQARDDVNDTRASLGASQNLFEQAIRNNSNSVVNIAASQSRIQDTDFAQAISQRATRDIVSQAALAVAGQANQNASHVLGLL